MKKMTLYLGLFFLICFISNLTLKHSISQEIENKPAYHLSFTSIGANLLESRLDCWAKINTITIDFEPDQELQNILIYLKLPADTANFLHQETEETNITQYGFLYNNVNYLFILQTEKNNHQESYLLITAVSEDGDTELRQLEKSLQQIVDARVYYTYKASIKFEQDYSGQQATMDTIMKNLQANILSTYHSGSSISATGYSFLLDRTVKPVCIGENKCNVQAAIKSNDQEKITEVYLGFPLLLNDY